MFEEFLREKTYNEYSKMFTISCEDIINFIDSPEVDLFWTMCLKNGDFLFFNIIDKGAIFKVLDEIKKSIVEDVDAEINAIEEAISEYTIRQQQISESICTKVGILDRFFKTKKYKQKIINDSLLIKEESNICNQVQIKQSELKALIEKKEIIKKISDVEKLPFKNNEELRNYCVDKNIQITSEDYFKYF